MHDGHRGLLERVLVDQRRVQADAIDVPLQKAASATLIKLLLRALQSRIAATSYRGIARGPTISIGLAIVDVDCFLTDREVQARANIAKNYAKATEKGRIAVFEGPLFREGDLVLS